MSKKENNSNTKVYTILSYIGILWLVGLLVQERNDKSVRFHVGQGILITIISLIINLINDIIVANVFVTTKFGYWGMAQYTTTSVLGNIIMFSLWVIPIALSIIGIINAAQGNDKELPIVGKFAFYK